MFLYQSKFVIGAIVFFACAMPGFAEKVQSLQINHCKIVGQISAQDLERLEKIKIFTEGGLLYTIPAMVYGVRDCRFKHDADALELKYRFKTRGTLNVIIIDVLEYDSTEAKFLLPSSKDPLAIIQSEARRIFGEKSCGIDWQNPEVNKIAGETETIYWGECNCRAAISRDLANRVIGLRISNICN